MKSSEVYIAECKVSNLELDELLDAINEYAQDQSSSDPAVMLSANIHGINQAHKYKWLLRMNNNAELVRNDSAGIQLAGKILGVPIKDRMTWADFGWDLAEYCEQKNLSMYFLGNEKGVAEKAKDELLKRYPSLEIVGTHHGFFKKEGAENEKVVEQINQLNPDILVVGFGMPLQERWILENRGKLNVGIIMTGGNCFNFLAGTESRAPKWMHENGLEWLYRFLKEPIRMFSRYIIGNPVFLLRVFKQKLFKPSKNNV